MSVLNFPRIYFKGFISWDPCTFNNNDFGAFPTYDPTQAALNWAFLATQGPQPGGITPANFTSTFRPWAIQLQSDTTDSPPGRRIPAEWNMFGSHAVSFVQYGDKSTTVTGGVLEAGCPGAGPDPLIGQPISIDPASLVDTNPTSFWSSQIYWKTFSIGGASCGLKGTRQFRMHSRWLNLGRIYSATSALTQPAASVGACFQTCIPRDAVQFTNGSAGSPTYSPLIGALQKAVAQPGAAGVMVRFSAYVNLYFQNGIFNNATQQPRSYEELAEVLAKAWEAWNANGDTSQFFSQPCYSHGVGAVGVWQPGELASVPVGRFLAATQNSITPLGLPPTPPPAAVALGPAVASVDFASQLISIDLNSTLPEVARPGTSTSDLTKVDVGPLTVGVQAADGTFTPLAPPIAYTGYQRSAYEASAGILDVPFDASQPAAAGLKGGTSVLAIQMQGKTALAEPAGGYSAQTDSRGIYLDQNETEEITIAVYRGGVPAPGSQVLVAKYDSNLGLVATTATQYVDFANGATQSLKTPTGATWVTVLTADAQGIATLAISAQAPGFPVLAFFPFAPGQPLPTPPPGLFGIPGLVPSGTITNAFYATVRVLPFDDGVPQEFLALWNSTRDPAQAWSFVYHRILYVYDMLFSVMLEEVNLGDRTAVEAAASTIAGMVSKAVTRESPFAMPVTRDLSEGKRKVLLLWCYLVQKGYPKSDIDLSVLNQVTPATHP